MFASAFVALALAATALAQDLKIESPASLIQCQPALLSWSGGEAPYFLAAIPGGQPSAAAIKDFGSQTGNSLTWNVDLPVGTSVTLRITDSKGNANYNSEVTIQAGSSTACLNASGSSAASGAASSATGAAGGVVASATSGAASAASAASSGVASAASAASSGVASVASAARSAASSGASAAASAASSARPSGSASAAGAASSPTGAATKLSFEATGIVAMIVGAIGVTLF